MNIVQQWLNRIIQPHRSISNAQEYRRVRLLIALVLALLVLTVIGVIATRQFEVNARLSVSAVMMFLAYCLSKTRSYRISAYFLTLGLIYPSFALILNSPTPLTEARILSATIWIPAAVVFAGLWLSWRETLLTSVILIVILQGVGQSVESISNINSGSYAGISALIFVISMVMTLSSYLIERDQKQITHQNAVLERQTQQLIEARDHALKANQFKTELLSKVSHELRTPLGAILGYSQMLTDGYFGNLSELQAEKLSEIVDSVQYLTALVNELLDQGQLEAGELLARREPFAPHRVVNQVSATMQVLAQDKDLTLTTDVDADVPNTLSGDPIHVQQILVNLIGNAIKFTHHGGIEVHVGMVNSTHWSMKVSDTGSGIPKKYHSQIFDPFRQVDGSMTREHSGAGLGLAIVKQLATLMGGQVRLDSEVGQGSTFTVMLPLAQTLEQIE